MYLCRQQRSTFVEITLVLQTQLRNDPKVSQGAQASAIAVCSRAKTVLSADSPAAAPAFQDRPDQTSTAGQEYPRLAYTM